MRGHLYLAWRYVARNRFKTAVLVLSIALIVVVPAGLRVLVAQSAEQLTARARATPLLIGARGSPLELVLSSLYFRAESPPAVRFSEFERVAAAGLATPIPLHVRYRSRGRPIVGTSPEYLDLRGLRLAGGRAFAVLGECVVGARLAREEGLAPGDTLVSSPESVFDLAGVYPLEMQVVGVLEPGGGPDDEAILVDVKTAWVIEGLWHGHQDLSRPEAATAVLGRDSEGITANASLREFTSITPENADTFHAHGDTADFPLTAIVVVPRDAKASAILQGRYQGDDERVQIVRPDGVIEELLGSVFTVEGYVVAALVFVGGAALATTALVFLLSIRLRRREIETMVRIGAPRGAVATVLSLEVLTVVAASLLLAWLLTAWIARSGSAFVRVLIDGG